MEKTELMKRYEAETGEDMPTVNVYKLLDWYKSFSIWLEDKAAAYDRLMSGGKHAISMKELANVLHMVIVATIEGQLVAFERVPKRSEWGGWFVQDLNCVYWGVPLPYAVKGDWKDILTLPDGWEDK